MMLKVSVMIVMCSSGAGWGEGSHRCCSVAEDCYCPVVNGSEKSDMLIFVTLPRTPICFGLFYLNLLAWLKNQYSFLLYQPKILHPAFSFPSVPMFHPRSLMYPAALF